MKASQKFLLTAVRNQLRLPAPTGAGYRDTECNCEPDDQFPATAGDVYVAVMPGGFMPGPTHNSSGGVRDFIYGVNVVVVRRVANVPRDRQRDVFLNHLDSLDDDIDRIIANVDWSQTVRVAANALITAETGSTQGFIYPLRFAGQVSAPVPVGAEKFGAASGKQEAGMMVTIPFHSARRITTL